MSQPKKILVAPLNWGLGHATRCVPIIWELQRQGATVVLASDGEALVLLQQVFPDLESIELPSYAIQYKGNSMTWNMAQQLPKILKTVWLEHRHIREISSRFNINGIISDNRFGCFSPAKPCVFLTHQVNIQTPFFLTKKLANFFNHLIIKRFDECWVPDIANEPNLSGQLSHPTPLSLRRKTKYIGALSRMATEGDSLNKQYGVVAVLSGPEPQRTMLEVALLEQAERIPVKFLLVQGKPKQAATHPQNSSKKVSIEIVPSMTIEALNQAILSSEIFIGRSGYSTVMDLARLGIPALLIPTPGQTEQEYLAEKLSEENLFFTQKQKELNLAEGILEAKKRKGLNGDFFNQEALSNAVSSFLEQC